MEGQEGHRLPLEGLTTWPPTQLSGTKLLLANWPHRSCGGRLPGKDRNTPLHTRATIWDLATRSPLELCSASTTPALVGREGVDSWLGRGLQLKGRKVQMQLTWRCRSWPHS